MHHCSLLVLVAPMCVEHERRPWLGKLVDIGLGGLGVVMVTIILHGVVGVVDVGIHA